MVGFDNNLLPNALKILINHKLKYPTKFSEDSSIESRLRHSAFTLKDTFQTILDNIDDQGPSKLKN